MKKLSKYVGLLALLGSSVSYGATVSFSVVENSGVANDGIIQNIGDQFSIVMSGADFPNTGGFTLLANFAPVATINTPTTTNGIVVPVTSPFAAGAIANSPFLSGNQFTVLAPTSGALPSGSFTAVQFNFTATALGFLNFSITDDGADNVWTDGDTFEPIPVTYDYSAISNVQVGVVPLPASVWLLGTALGLVGIRAKAKRRQA